MDNNKMTTVVDTETDIKTEVEIIGGQEGDVLEEEIVIEQVEDVEEQIEEIKEEEKKIILIDFDDTMVKSSEEVIRQLNVKMGEFESTKTIKDLKDWGFKSIKKDITEKEIIDIFESDDFFDNVHFNDKFVDFIVKYIMKFRLICVSKGTKENLRKKKNFINRIFNQKETTMEFIGIEFEKEDTGCLNLDKSGIFFPEGIYMAIEDNTKALLSINADNKVLIRNYNDFSWNKTPKNEENLYVVNTFEEIINIIEFDMNNGLLSEDFGKLPEEVYEESEEFTGDYI
jgi:hypothetical protein